MTDAQTTLQKAQSISTILATLAIPLILASTGYYVQKTIAENSLKKDYLDMAVGILRGGGESADPEMRAWATSVVSKFSPVPFTAKAKFSLDAAFNINPVMPALPEVARQNELDKLCDPSCLGALTDKHRQWVVSLATEDGVIQKLTEITDLSVQYNIDLAEALDRARIAGRSCEAIYDSVRDINNRVEPLARAGKD